MSSASPDTAGSSSARPALSAKIVILYLVVGLALAALATWLMGAIFYELVGEQLPGAARPWLALGLGVGVGLVIPVVVAVRSARQGRTFLRVFAGLGVLTVLVLLGLATALSGRAIAHHGAWFSELGGERSAELQDSMAELAQLLPGTPPLVEVVDAGPLPVDAGPATQPAGPLTPQQVFARAADAVVYIGVRADPPKDSVVARFMSEMGMREIEGHGSGFAVSPDGLIVTNHHVVGEARSAQVRLRDGRRFDAVTVLALDPGNDLALIQVAASGLTTVQPVDDDAIAVGSPAFAIGSPLGLDFTLTAGIVSAQREQEQTQFIQMQTDIAPGSSGGPVLDDHARVIGVSTAVRGPGLNLAVAARHVRALLELARQPRALEPWRTGVELVAVEFEGSQANPVLRAQVQEIAGVAGKILDGCRAELPPAGGEVVVPLLMARRSEREPRSTLGAAADACAVRPLGQLGMLVTMLLQGSPGLERVVLRFQPPAAAAVDGGASAEAGRPSPIALVFASKATGADAGATAR